MTNITNNAENKQNMAAMISLLKEIAKLAPHPDKPDDKGPVSVKLPPEILAKANEADDGIGGMILESMIDTAFGGMMPAHLDEINFSNAVNTYEIYRQDKDSHDMAVARRDMENQYKRDILSSEPKQSREKLIEAYMRDLPQRIILERKAALLAKKMGNNEIINDKALHNFAPSPKSDYMSVM